MASSIAIRRRQVVDADPEITGLFEGTYIARYVRYLCSKGRYQETYDPYYQSDATCAKGLGGIAQGCRGSLFIYTVSGRRHCTAGGRTHCHHASRCEDLARHI